MIIGKKIELTFGPRWSKKKNWLHRKYSIQFTISISFSQQMLIMENNS